MQQHDRRLRQPFDVLGVLRAMVASKDSAAGPIHYVGLCTTTTLGHAHKMASKYLLQTTTDLYGTGAYTSHIRVRWAAQVPDRHRTALSDLPGRRHAGEGC